MKIKNMLKTGKMADSIPDSQIFITDSQVSITDFQVDIAQGSKARSVQGGSIRKKSENELSGSLARLGQNRWLLWVVIVYISYNQPQLCAVGVGSATICIAQV
jgi:hypothetical protein